MYLIESILFSTTILIINYFYYPLSILFIGDIVNPYQLLSLFMAIRYGAIKGFISFLIIMAIGSSNVMLNNQTEKFYDVQTLYFALAAFLVTHVAGQLSDFKSDEIFLMKDAHNKLSLDFHKCSENNVALSNANKDLTHKVVSHFHSLSTVYEAAQKLEALDSGELFSAAVGLLENHVGVQTAAIYSLKKDALYIRAGIGTERLAPFPEIIKLGSDKMINIAIAEKRTVSKRSEIFDVSKENNPEEAGSHLVVAPVMENGVVDGIIVVEKMPMENFTDSAVGIISIIGQWVAICINKLDKCSKCRRKSLMLRRFVIANASAAKKVIRDTTA